jgi:hypothetical protein
MQAKTAALLDNRARGKDRLRGHFLTLLYSMREQAGKRLRTAPSGDTTSVSRDT